MRFVRPLRNSEGLSGVFRNGTLYRPEALEGRLREALWHPEFLIFAQPCAWSSAAAQPGASEPRLTRRLESLARRHRLEAFGGNPYLVESVVLSIR